MAEKLRSLLLLLLLLMPLLLLCVDSVDYDTHGGPVDGKLNVHLVPHSHLEVGKLKTVDQYYVGSRKSQVRAPAVQYILDSVISALDENQNRKFIFAEQAFFQRWWRRQSQLKQKMVQRLVEAGQLEFINGGWCMHDEASTHYIDMIDQTSLGHRYIKKQFKKVPRIGWQIDTFGHSAVQAYLLGAEDGRVNAFYSTPTIYVDANHAKNITWPLKVDDFFPYADFPHGYWTGYFTSRPALKKYVRQLSAYLQVARQLEFLIGRGTVELTTDPLEEAMAILQDHHAITGTERQHVADDYAKRLDLAAAQVDNLVGSVLTILLTSKLEAYYKKEMRKLEAHSKMERSWHGNSVDESLSLRRRPNVSMDRHRLLKVQQCPLLNISFCPPSEADLVVGKTLVVVAYNTLGWKRKELIRIPVTNTILEVKDSTGKIIPSQFIPLSRGTKMLRNIYIPKGSQNLTSWLLFYASVPPFGYNTYFVTTSEASNPNQASHSFVKKLDTVGKAFSISRALNLTFSGLTRQLMHFENHRTKVIRVLDNSEHVEVDYVVGPVPIEDWIGKNVVTRFYTNISSAGEFYTDSNGRDFLKRVRNYRSDWNLNVTEPVAGNYYPVNLGLYLKDNEKESSLLVDRALGGSSLTDGELELMLHRRLLSDDDKGLGEDLNENTCIEGACEGLVIQGQYFLSINPNGKAARWRRTQGQKIYAPLQLSFIVISESDQRKLITPKFSSFIAGYQLPPNIVIITLQELDDKTLLIRLAHIYEANEDADLSQMATVDLESLFAHRKIDYISELNLSANQQKSEMKPLKWNFESASQMAESPIRGAPLKDGQLLLEIAPMEIRTLCINFKIDK